MKIYRVLSKEEYAAFQETGTLTYSSGKRLRPERFLNPSMAYDRTGKFFFFHLEDAVFFSKAFDDYEFESNIIELDVDPKEVFPYLATGEYIYKDNSTDDNRHFYPELCLEDDYVSQKLKKGEYRIIPYSYRKRLTSPRKNSEREPNYVALGKELQNLAALRRMLKESIVDKIGAMRKAKNIKVDVSHPESSAERDEAFEKNLKFYGSVGLTEEELDYINKRYCDFIEAHETQVEAVKKAYRNFYLEHEKYMMLTPVEGENNAK